MLSMIAWGARGDSQDYTSMWNKHGREGVNAPKGRASALTY